MESDPEVEAGEEVRLKSGSELGGCETSEGL